MSSSTRRLLPLLLVCLAGPVAAEPRDGRSGAEQSAAAHRQAAQAHEAREGGRSLAAAVRRVERATGGQILSAERVPFDGRDMNRIKVVDATGRVRVITEDPQRPLPRPDRDD